MPETPYPRPTTRDVAIWVDLRHAMSSLTTAEFYLGFTVEKPRELDFEAVRLHLQDVRRILGAVALAHAENIEATK